MISLFKPFVAVFRVCFPARRCAFVHATPGAEHLPFVSWCTKGCRHVGAHASHYTSHFPDDRVAWRDWLSLPPRERNP